MLHWSQDASTGWTRKSWVWSMATKQTCLSCESSAGDGKPRRWGCRRPVRDYQAVGMRASPLTCVHPDRTPTAGRLKPSAPPRADRASGDAALEPGRLPPRMLTRYRGAATLNRSRGARRRPARSHVSSSEIAFLAIGLIIGAAIGAAISEAVRVRPAPRRHVRVTISPNSVSPRHSRTLAERGDGAGEGPAPGSPDERAWAGEPDPEAPASPPGAAPARTPVPSAGTGVPTTAVAVPVEPASSVPVGPGTSVALPESRPPTAAPAPAERPAPPAGDTPRDTPSRPPNGPGSRAPLASAVLTPSTTS